MGRVSKCQSCGLTLGPFYWPTLESLSEQHDAAFEKIDKKTRDYVLSSELSKNIRLVCKTHMLNHEKEFQIITSIAHSVMLGLLFWCDAEYIMMEAFKRNNMSMIEESKSVAITLDMGTSINPVVGCGCVET